jgi:hypothetical protein
VGQERIELAKVLEETFVSMQIWHIEHKGISIAN